MRSTRLCSMALICLALAAPAAADVTTKHKSSGKGMVGGMASGEMTQYVKGLKIRNDQTMGGKQTSTIIDASAHQMIVIDHAKREVEVYDMASFGSSMAKVPVGDIKTSVTPTGQTRQIAGATCTVYDVKVTAPMAMGKDEMSLVLGGPYCLVKNGPGQADYVALYKAIAENGFLGDPRQAKAQPALVKAMTEMSKKMSELGVPYSTEVNISFEGGPMAAMMSKMGGNTMTSEVTSVSTDAIADSTFEVPAGYKVNKRS
jgi:hypothetical protein